MKNNLRRIFSRISSLTLIFIQYIPVIGPWYGIMFLPIILYFITVLIMYPKFIMLELSSIFFSWNFIFGKITIVVGLIIFCYALSNFLRRTSPIATNGLYSKIRHPQYLGLITITLGFTLMSIEQALKITILDTWLISLVGYVLLAYCEEKHLLKEHHELYKQYMEKTHFMLPINPPKNFPETLFTMIFMLSIALLCSIFLSTF